MATFARLKTVALVVAAALGAPALADDTASINNGGGNGNGNNGNDLQLTVLSSQPYLVSGGDALVRVDAPKQVDPSSIRVTLNGHDVTASFVPNAASQSLTGLVTGLVLGNNTLVATAVKNHNGNGPSKSITLTNYPIAGPMISGPHEDPFFCQTQQFTLPVTGGNLGASSPPDCSIATRIDYVYSANGTSFKPMDPTQPAPADVTTTTTNAGVTVRFIVRVETGTVNRGIYQIAILHDPYNEPAPTWNVHPAGWNGKLIYQHGGGCQGGWYIQGASTGGVLTAQHLGRGFARASSSLNVFGNNCNDLLASETTLMTKERFIEHYGVPKWTIGTGSSGGSYQSHQTGDNYPGTFDGLVTMNSFPDVTTGVITLADARLFDTLFNTTLPGVFNDDKQKAITGWRQVAETVFLSRDPGTSALRLDPTSQFNAIIPLALRYPTGPVRATVADHTVNVFGERPNGFAKRPLDNVGVQYGLMALNAGTITPDEFLLVNEKIGGVDIDFVHTTARTSADPGTMHRAYVSGRVLNGGGGLKNVPMITQHGIGDPVVDGNIHLKFYSWAVRHRLLDQNGTFANQVIVAPFNNSDDLFEQMNRWLDAIWADSSGRSLQKKVIANKPADLYDACYDSTGTKIPETDTLDPWQPSACYTLDLTSRTPALAAGGPIEGSIIKCQLKFIDPRDYAVHFTLQQWVKLFQIFPTGVCDYSKPGVEQTFDLQTWASFGPSKTNLIFDITRQ
jgi:hypothetical protein